MHLRVSKKAVRPLLNSIYYIALSLVFVLFIDLPQAIASDDEFVVGVFPRRNAIATTTLFKPLVLYLGEQLQRKVRLETSKDFASFWQGVKEQRYDLVHFNQYHYVKAHKELGYEVILKNEEFSFSTIAAAIVVKKNSEIKKLQDLKGQSISFGGGKKAMVSFIAASYLLKKAGLTNDMYQTKFSKNPPNAVLATYFGVTVAAGAGNRVLSLPVLKKQAEVNELRYLAVGEELAHLPWAVNKRVKKDLSFKIQSILTNLANHTGGLKLLKQAKVTKFVIARDADYDRHRIVIREILGEDY